jgi:hypothetical protein
VTGVTHISVGAAVGKFIPNPILAFFVGILSHLLIDKIPHFWPKTKEGQRLIIWLDSAASLLLIILLCFLPLDNKLSVLGCAIGSASVDFILVIFPKLFKNLKSKPIVMWHENRQFHYSQFAYIFTDIGLILTSLVIMVI